MPNSSDRVQQTVTAIEKQNKTHDATPSNIYTELNKLRREDTCNGKLNAAQYKADLSQVNAKLRGVLPTVDIQDDGNNQAVLRGISQPGKAPKGGAPSLVTEAHGTTYKYDASGHVQSWTKGKDTWTYNAQDGKYHETIGGKKTNNTSSDIVAMSGNGTETITKPDGSTSTVSNWGGTIERNPQGKITEETRGHDVKKFQYDKSGNLTSMTDQAKGKPEVTYTKAADGKFYASTDKNHKNPLDITVEPDKTKAGQQKQDGVVRITDEKTGNYTDERWGGTNVNYNKDNQLTSIDYSNGNKATEFKYSKSDPTQISEFTMTGKDGKPHTYKYDNGMISVDGGKPVKGTVTTSDTGALTVTETGNGTDAQYSETKFGLSGQQIDLRKFGSNIEPVDITNAHGDVSKFQYDSSGNLTSVNAHGYNLHLKGNQWVDASGQPVNVTPTIDANGTFSLTKPDGTFISWDSAGTMLEGTPENPTPTVLPYWMQGFGHFLTV